MMLGRQLFFSLQVNAVMVLTACGLTGLSATAVAQAGGSTLAVKAADQPPEATQDQAKRKQVSGKRIKELFTFVGQHHPDIRPLLRSLQKGQPEEFQRAMQQLDREVQVLQNQKKNAPDRYKRSLEMWVLRSKTKLIAAQMAVADDDSKLQKMEQEIRKLLNRHYQVRADQVKEDLNTLKERTQRLQSQLNDLNQKRGEMINRQVDGFKRSADRIRRNRDK